MTAEKSLMSDKDLHTLSDLSIYNCTRFGPYTAIIYEDQQDVREYTNMHIAREAAQLATGLQTLGIDKGDRVIVMMLNCPEVIISYQAIARAGGIIIPVMPLLKPPEVRYIAENSAAKAVITSPILLPLLRSALA
ncbi:MAG: long-chain fatty acid--CoA ligase, partial [Chloroflexi bacterium]